MSPRDGFRARVLRKLQNRSLTVRSCRLTDDIRWVFRGDDDACSHHELVPRFPEVDHVNAVVSALVHCKYEERKRRERDVNKKDR